MLYSEVLQDLTFVLFSFLLLLGVSIRFGANVFMNVYFIGLLTVQSSVLSVMVKVSINNSVTNVMLL